MRKWLVILTVFFLAAAPMVIEAAAPRGSEVNAPDRPDQGSPAP